MFEPSASIYFSLHFYELAFSAAIQKGLCDDYYQAIAPTTLAARHGSSHTKSQINQLGLLSYCPEAASKRRKIDGILIERFSWALFAQVLWSSAALQTCPFFVYSMPGFWYSTAITAAASALFSISYGISSTFIVPGVSSPKWTSFAQADSYTEKSSAKKSPDQQTFDRAMELANHAVAAYQAASREKETTYALVFTQRERTLWQATLQTLERIPASSDLYEQASAKRTQYVGLLANAESKLNAQNANFFVPILKGVGVDASRVHITLCQMDAKPTRSYSPESATDSNKLSMEHCRHHQGDVQLASPASLIKLPIAIALMDKLNTEDIELDTKLYIDPSNFTENAEGASIDIDEEYTIDQVVTRMINQSNNIATNQLIDYVGREKIAQTLTDRGYTDTLVDHKLAGDRILPPNPGTQSNQSTSNDLTAMMVDTYSLQNPGDEALLTALASQTDREFGYQTLKEMGPDVAWLGEKTGQNNRVIGTTLAMNVGGDRYALTVAIDNSANPAAIRAIIESTAQYLADYGSLMQARGR